MGIDFNAEFTKLNTNTTGESANILDAEEVSAAKANNSIWTVSEGMTAEDFKEQNQHCSEYDINKDGVVTVAEQKSSIAAELKNVWTPSIARFFKDDIAYDDSNSNIAQQITQQVAARIQNCLNHIQWAKNNNVDIFTDNTDTGVEDKDGEVTTITSTDGTSTYIAPKEPPVSQIEKHENGDRTTTYADGDTMTHNSNSLLLASTSGRWSYKYEYNEDGSYTYVGTRDDNWKFKGAYDTNKQVVGTYYVTANGNYKAQARPGETIDQTLTRLGITDPRDVAAVKQANPKATRRGAFLASEDPYAFGDVYIPKYVIENMKKNGTYDENKLMGKA